MPLTAEVQSAVSLLESLQGSLRGCEEPRLGVQYTNDLNTLISVLHNPVLNKIIAIQDSIHDLKKELARHPSLLPSDFDISPRRGELTIHFPPDGVEEDGGGGTEIYPKKSNALVDIQSSSRELIDADQSVHNSYETHPLGDSEPPSPHRQWLKNGRGPDGDSEGELARNDEDEEGSDGIPQSITNSTLDTELRQLIRVAAEGRQIHHIQLYKPEGTSLGFSVVGLKSEQRGDLGIYVQEIQPTGIAAKDGRLRDGDQILAIDGQVLDSYISHQQAISILQKANKLVDLVVARAPIIESVEESQPEDDPEEEQLQLLRQESLRRQNQHLDSTLLREQIFLQQGKYNTTHIVPPSTESRTSNMLNTEWAQVEVIHLVNDGSGLGFGIIGGRSTGVVVKTILPGGVADREGRLQSGDHILQIGEVNLRGMGSDQVASVLRQAGSHVRLVVARPVESASPDFQIGRTAPIVETRVLNDPEELDRHLNLITNGFPSSSIALSSIGGNDGPASSSTSSASTVPAGVPTNGHSDYLNGDSELLTVNNQIASTSAAVAVVASDGHLTSAGGSYLPMEVISPCDENTVVEGGEGMSLADLPEMENIDLDLAKDHQGLGITIAGYVCEREELSGIFVKSINAGSAADRSGQVRVNDQIVEVDGKSLTGLSNHAAVEVLRSTGQRVRLRLARYLRGPKFEQLQQAIANSELKTTPSTPNPPRAPQGEVPSSEAIRTALDELEAEDQHHRSHESLVEAYNPSVAPPVPHHPLAAQQLSVGLGKDSYEEESSSRVISTSDVMQGSSKPPSEKRLDDLELLIDSDYSGDLQPTVEGAVVRKWSTLVGSDLDIVVAQLQKFERGGGLGISLEGTVDVEDGKEVRPHHYIRSILPDGPVGRDGRLKSGDEFLEVNNQTLLGLNHVEVVTILKELPQFVRIVCGRRVSGSGTPIHSGEVSNRDVFGARNVLGGSLQSLVPSSERLVKAKSDGSLASSTTNANSDSNSFTKVKSRSLEPLTGLAMWSSEPQHIELIKGERGLGFSILDYQDPMNPQETVIVIRSLVPGGVAEKDGRLIPGDRLVGVNGTSLEKASLDEAVAELKGAPKGPVIISVAKPISVLESPGQLDLILGDLGSSEAGSDVTEEVTEWNQEHDYTQEQIEERRKRRKTNDSVISTSSVPPALPITDPPMLDRDASVLMVPVATERLIGGSSSSSASNSAGGELFKGGSEGGRPSLHSESQPMFLSSSASPVVAPSSGEEEISPQGSPIPHPRIHSLANILPRQLERVVKIRKGGDQLGINIEVVDQGVNGVVVSSLVRGGAVHKDGRIRAGDLLVSVNSESMKNITNSQARAILKRTQLISTDVCIVFIPGEEAAKHRESRLQSFRPDIIETAQERISQRSYGIRDSSEDDLHGVTSDLTRSSTAPSFITRQLTRSRDPSQEETLDTHPVEPTPLELQFVEARPSSSLSDVSGAAATVVTLKNAISEVLGTEDRSRSSQKAGREGTEEGPFTITFRNVTEAGLVRGDLQSHSEEVLRAPAGIETCSEGRTTSSTTPPAMDGKHWGPERIVEVKRDENGSLGISIVGGKVDISWSGSSVTGIFVKNVLANSPAGRSGLLKTGDRILEVEGVDLRTATHEKAVEVIKKTGNPVTFVVQSLVQWNTPSTPVSRESSRLGIHASEAVPPARTPTPELIQPGQSDQKKQELQDKEKEQQMKDALRRSLDQEEDDSSEEEDLRVLQGRTTSKKGVEIDRASAGALKRSKSDPHEEDKFGYTSQKVQKKYSSPEGEIHLVDLQKGSCGLGISLAGHRDRSQMSVYVCGMNPSGNAYKDGRIKVGDEILEVNGYVVEGRSHLNASTIFKGIPGPSIKIIVRRKKSGLQDMAVKPLTQFPVTLEDESPEEKYARFKGLTKFVMKKGQFGLGIMIIEGKHAEYGNGIFISDLQEGSTASEAGLMVGDMILSVNKEDMIGVDYEMAASILKKTEGVITMWVANAARVTGSTTSSTDGIPGKIAPPTPAKNAEPKKPEEPPADPSSAEIKPGRETTIEIVKEKMGLGLSIVGGTDTLLGAIIIHEVYPDGAAAKDGRLRPGDQILEVNSEDFRIITHQKALNVLRQTPSKVKMVVYREEGTQKEEDLYDVISVQLTKKSGKGLGLSIVGRKNGPGVFISDLVPGGVAESDGRLMQGDQILEVNEKDLRTASQEQAAAILKCAPASVSMKIGRLKPGKKISPSINPTWPMTITEGPPRTPSSLSPEFPFPHPPLLISSHTIPQLQSSSSSIPLSTPQTPPAAVPSLPPSSPLRTVVLERGDDGLGFSIVGGFGSNLGDLPIYVKSVFDRGAAAREGSLRRGDQILQVNGHSLAGLTHAQAVGILKDAKGTVTLTILPSK